ncbi:MAG: stage III sporulation protein AG [Clostridia bacterium]|nr:stage III sporulation protein AG [Clostridia bacterium]
MEEKFNLKKPQLKKLNHLVILAAVGILLIMLAGMFSNKEPATQGSKEPNLQISPLEQGVPATAPTDQVSTEEKLLEAELEATLGNMEGVGKVDVNIRLAGTTQQNFAEEKAANTKTNQERDERGGTRTTTEKNETEKPVIIRRGNSEEVPVVAQALRAEIQGVLVVAEGAKNPETREMLTEAVTSLFGLPANKVRVLPRKVETTKGR